jgi:spermidine synthase
VVEQIARDPRYFGFLAACGNSATIVLGDARLMIADAPDAAYDALVVDAFSSDSIPMHLLTREAMALYLRKLAPDGRILFHITSQRLDLRPVIASLAADAGVSARAVVDRPVVPDLHRAPSVAVAVAGRRANLDGLSPADGWADMVAADPAYLWTDQRSDILQVIRFGLN